MLTVRIVLGSLYVIVACAGCFPLGRLPEIDDIPTGAARVEAMADAFEQPADHPLLDVPAGTVMDDLGGLSGCWGAYAGPELVTAPLDALVEFYRFDFDAEQMIHQGIQRNAEGGLWTLIGLDFDVGWEDVYSFRVSGPDRITVQWLSGRLTSNVRDAEFPERPEDRPDPDPVDRQITLSGDQFRFGDSEGGTSLDFWGSDRANLVFFRFDCPE